MKKIFITIALLFAGATSYYFAYGQKAAVEQLKKLVDKQLQVLQKNGFELEDREIGDDSEHFVLKYADPLKISNYLQSKKMDISVEESEEFKGLKLATDIKYLDGVFSAVSADIYLDAFSDSLMSEASEKDQKILEKIILDKTLLLHIEIDKFFGSFEGHIKDIDKVIESDDPLTIVSKGFKFSGETDGNMLLTSSNSIENLTLQAKSGSNLIVEKLEGRYEQEAGDLYDYGTKYTIRKISFYNEDKLGSTLKDITLKSSAKSHQDLMKTDLDIAIGSSAIKEPNGEHIFEGSSMRVSLENISKSAIEKMSGVDANNSKAFDEILQELLSKDSILNIEQIAIAKIQDPKNREMIDGFSLTGSAKLGKSINAKELQSNPLLLLDTVEIRSHIEFSEKMYILLQKRPELTLISLMFKPVIKKDKVIFDIEYKKSNLEINGKSLF